MPLGKDVAVTCKGGLVITMDNDRLVAALLASTTCKEKENVPLLVGVP